MKRLPASLLMIVALALVLFSACAKEPAAPKVGVTVEPVKLRLFQPLPEAVVSATNPLTEEKVALGRMLYYEARLSKSQQISCNSCHDLNQYGVDGQMTSDGHKGKKGNRNSPTVYNAAGHFVQFWDGRAADVEEQAKGPVMNPAEMAMPSGKQVIAVLKSMPEYAEAFKKAFPEHKDAITYDNVAKAIGAFERRLITPSRWDKFIRGDQAALTDEEKTGFNDYMETGCQACHAGAYLGGRQYQRLGSAKPWPDQSDPGRAQVTKSEADRMVFKVPSLRNIEKTAPYYHNGQVESLEDAISRMAEYQLGKTLAPEKVKSIEAFLRTLTGNIPSEYIKRPELPKSTSKTPKADIS
jgi:cytochrome c peroxidase